MQLKSPVIITPRVLPGVRISDTFVSLTYYTLPGRDNRVRYRYYIDGEIQYTASDLETRSPNLQQALSTLLSFLSAAAEAYHYTLTGRPASENFDLFPTEVNEWAYQNSDDISMLAMELEEVSGLIVE